MLKNGDTLSYSIETVSKAATDREELIEFLIHSPGESHGEEKWRTRLQFWWENNPASQAGQPWGWILRYNSQVAGFLGCVPMMYEYRNASIPAVAASTWRVLPEHRGQSLRLFLPLYKLSQEMPVLNTSPSPAVIQVLERSGFQSNPASTRHFFWVGRFLSPLTAFIAGRGKGFPKLAEGGRLVTDVNTVTSVAGKVMCQERLEKCITPAYLRWLLSTPMEKLFFVGYEDRSGNLSSYLVLKEDVFKKLPAWIVVDWFTAGESMEELAALTGALCCRPSLISGKKGVRILGAVSFEGDNSWNNTPALYRRQTPVKHYYGLPKELKMCKKRCVPAEGDYLL